jgi:hypothetical protein
LTEKKESWEYGGFGIASSPKSCSIKAWTNWSNVAGDGEGIRISSKHQRVNVLKFFVYNKVNVYNFQCVTIFEGNTIFSSQYM